MNVMTKQSPRLTAMTVYLSWRDDSEGDRVALLAMTKTDCHCEEHSDEAISLTDRKDGLYNMVR